MTFDTETMRSWPPNCKPAGATREYNMLLRSQNGEIINHEAVSAKTGYGVIHKQSLAPGSYQLIVINFGEAQKDQDFTVTTYAENKIEILEQKQYLEKKIS